MNGDDGSSFAVMSSWCCAEKLCECHVVLLVVQSAVLKFVISLPFVLAHWADGYKKKEAELRAISILDERIEERPPAPDPAGVAEDELQTAVLSKILDVIPESGLFTAGVSKVEEQGKAHYGGNLPDFMAVFLQKMKVAAEAHRLSNGRELRELCSKLRDVDLLKLADAVCGELSNRCIEEMNEDVKTLKQQLKKSILYYDGKRAEHEKRLTPSLANPNYARVLQLLKEAEAKRHEDSVSALEQYKILFANLLQRHACGYVHRLFLTFRAIVVIVDALPLATHFNPLPGDESIVESRMSKAVSRASWRAG